MKKGEDEKKKGVETWKEGRNERNVRRRGE